MGRKINVVQQAEKEVPTEVIAQSIADIADGMRKLRAGRLNDRALVLLIQQASVGKPSLATIQAVLDGIENLERTYLRKRG